MGNKNARVIIPLAIAVWVLAILAFGVGLPSVVSVALTVLLVLVMAIGVPSIVFYLMADTGWNQLKKHFRAGDRFTGRWTTVPTGQLAMVSVHTEDFQRMKGRFTGTLRVGTTDDALYLSTLLTRIPVIGRFFPVLGIPWRDVTRATKYEAEGWTSKSGPGAVSARYDSGYTGEFVEIEIGEPRVFVQLPMSVLGSGATQLRFDEAL